MADGQIGQLHILPHTGIQAGIRVGVDVRWVPCERIENVGLALREKGAPEVVGPQATLRARKIAAAFEKAAQEPPPLPLRNESSSQ
jgi:hypothetical protein